MLPHLLGGHIVGGIGVLVQPGQAGVGLEPQRQAGGLAQLVQVGQVFLQAAPAVDADHLHAQGGQLFASLGGADAHHGAFAAIIAEGANQRQGADRAHSLDGGAHLGQVELGLHHQQVGAGLGQGLGLGGVGGGGIGRLDRPIRLEQLPHRAKRACHQCLCPGSLPGQRHGALVDLQHPVSQR